MITELLMNLIYNILNKLLAFEIPSLPEEVQGYVDSLFEYLVPAGSVLANYTPLPYLMDLFTIILAVDVGIMLYKLVMWILNKIPWLDID